MSLKFNGCEAKADGRGNDFEFSTAVGKNNGCKNVQGQLRNVYGKVPLDKSNTQRCVIKFRQEKLQHTANHIQETQQL